MSAKRNIALDIMKGLGLFLIIFDHCDPIGVEFKRWSMSFMMPMFFLVGGYLYRPNESVWQDTLKAAKRLVVPYIAGVLGMTLISVYVWHNGTWLQGLDMLVSAAGVPAFHCRYLTQWACVGAFWFFMAMFWCRVIFNTVYTKTGKARFPLLFLIAVAGYLLLRFVIRLPLGISEGLSMSGFYLLGHLFALARRKYLDMDTAVQHRWDIGLTVLLVAVVCLWAWTVRHSEVICSAGYYKHHLANIIGACGITYIYYWLCQGIAQFMPKTCALLTLAGYGSLFLLWIHKLSLHVIFLWPNILNIHLDAASPCSTALFLIAQWAFCMLMLIIVAQSKVLTNFFGIYKPANITL